MSNFEFDLSGLPAYVMLHDINESGMVRNLKRMVSVFHQFGYKAEE